jgi:mannosyltransferase OCH1-like enzyme
LTQLEIKRPAASLPVFLFIPQLLTLNNGSIKGMSDVTNPIPKIIHYVWVGDKPLTPLAERCIASWREHLPDYEIKLWNEQNSPMQHHYVQEMYRQKKWAFVSDYIRFFVLEKEGGIYLDTDTEVLKSFDSLLNHGAFFGKTKDGMIAAGVIGAVPHHPAIKAMLDVYDTDREYSTARTSPITVTEVLEQNSFADVFVYEFPYFNPCDDGENCTAAKLLLAYTNNHWAESWVKFAKLRKFLRRVGLMPIVKRLKNYIKGELE